MLGIIQQWLLRVVFNMSFKDFDAALKSSGRPSFVLGGQKFTCRAPAKMAWARWNSIIGDLDSGPAGSVEAETERTKKLFMKVLVSADRDRFKELLEYEGSDDDSEDEDRPVIANSQVAELIPWILEVYTGKAEESESESSPKPSSTGRPLKSVSLDVVETK